MRVGVVGAGITGLALSHYLGREGVDHVVLEAGELPGGVIQTRTVRGRILELGPQRTRLNAPLVALVKTLGLEGEMLRVPADLPLFVYRGGKLRRVPLSLREAVSTDLISPPGKLRILLEPLTGPGRGGETVAGFFIRKLGREAYVHLLGPLYGGIYGSDPATMYLRHSLGPTLRLMGVERSLLLALLRFARRGGGASFPTVSFRRGLGQLVEALYGAVRERVHLGTPVRELRGREGAFELVTPRGVERVDRVVLTVPAAEAARLLAELAPDAARRLAGLSYNTLAVVHLRSDAPLRGLGYQVSYGEELRTRGVTWNASLFGRDGVYTAFLGGATDPGILKRPDAAIGEIAREEFREVTGWEAEVIQVNRTWIPAWDRTWEAMEGLRLPPGVELCTNYESRVGIPGRVLRALGLVRSLRTPD